MYQNHQPPPSPSPRQRQRRPSNDGMPPNPSPYSKAHTAASSQGIDNAKVKANVNVNANTSAFFNSTPNPKPQVAATLPFSKPPPAAIRLQSHGSANAAFNTFGLRSNESVSTMTNGNRTLDIGIGALHSHGSNAALNNVAVPTTIQVTKARSMRGTIPTATRTGSSGTLGNGLSTTATANATANATHFFTQSIPTLNENHSMHSDAQSSSSNLNGHEHEYDRAQYESPALSTAVNIFSKTASALYQTTAAAVHAAENVGDRVGVLRQDFVKMTAPLEERALSVSADADADSGADKNGPPGPPGTLFGRKVGGSGGRGKGNAPGMSGARKPPVITTTSAMFQNEAGGVSGDVNANVIIPPLSQPSPTRSVRSAAEMFGYSASTPTTLEMRSASPLPPTIRSSSPVPVPIPITVGKILNASSLFGNVPPPSARAPSPVPVRSASPALVPARVASPAPQVSVDANASSFFGQSSGNTGEILSAGIGVSNDVGKMANGPTSVRGQGDFFGQQAETAVQTSGATHAITAAATFGQTAPPATACMIDGNVNVNVNSATQMFGGPLPSERVAAVVQEAVKNASNARNTFEQPLISLEKPSSKISETPPRPQVTSNAKPSTTSTPARQAAKITESSPARSTSSLFQRPPMPTQQTASTPTRNEEMERKPVTSTPGSIPPKRLTPKSTPIQSKPLPHFSKPRLPSPVPRRPRAPGTEDKKNILFALPIKKPLTLPHPKRKSSFTDKLLARKDVISTPVCEDGKSVNSVESRSARSGNSTSGGMFRIPPPLQISPSPNLRRMKKEEVMSPLQSPSSPSMHVMEKFPAEDDVQVPLPVTHKFAIEECVNAIASTENAASEVQATSCAVNEAIDAEDNIEVKIQPPPPTVLPPLPPGWDELRTLDTGIIYYFNPTTRVVTWDRPSPIDVAPSLPLPLRKEKDKSSSTEVSNVRVTAVAEVDDTIVSSQNCVDSISTVAQEFVTPIISNAAKQVTLPPSTKKVLVVPEITTDEANVCVKNSEAQKSIADDFVHIRNNESANTGKLYQEGLANQLLSAQKEKSQWIEIADGSTGVPYYYNEADNVTSWEKPSSLSSPLEASAKNESSEGDSHDEEPAWTKSCGPEHASTLYPETTADETNLKIVEEITDAGCDDIISPMVNSLDISISALGLDDHQDDCVSSDEHLDEQSDFPKEWTEMFDEASGRPYYFNEASDITQWEKPELTNQSNEKETVDAPDDILQVVNTPDAIEPNSTEQEPLNEDTLFETNVTPEEIHDQDSAIDVNDTLPNGWFEMVDESSGQPYYFNEEEAITQWEMPSSAAAEMQNGDQVDQKIQPVEEAKEEIMDNKGTKEESTEPVDIAFMEVPETLPEDETPADTVTDEASHQPFHLNEHENIIQMERPALDAAANEKYLQSEIATEKFEEINRTLVGQVINDNIDVNDAKQILDRSNIPDEYITVANQPRGQPPLSDEVTELPPGWVQVEDKSSGQLYYFNEVENIAQWEKPEIPQNESQQNLQDSENNVEPKVDEHNVHDILENKIEDETSTLPAGWVEMRDNKLGNIFFFNEAENITQREKPEEKSEGQYDIAGAQTQSFETLISEPEISQTFDTAITAVSNNQDADIPNSAEPLQQNFDAEGNLRYVLPAGWVELVDESSGQSYYFNEVENITQWESPELISVAPVSLDESKELVEEVALGADVQASTKTEEVVAKIIDTPATDGDNDDNYDESVAEVALPAGWVELVDESSGQPYYFNEVENITQWESPDTVQKNEVDIVAISDIRGNNPDSTDQVNEVAPTTETTVTNSALELPPGWVELVDEACGKAYFYNESKKSTQWEKPEKDPEDKTNKPHVGTINKDSIVNVISTSQDGWVKVDVSCLDMSQTGSVGVSTTTNYELPIDWVELIDPSSGKTYYFNEVEKITQWQRPASKTATSAPVPGRKTEFRPRPPHAIVTFGFGGRLCIMKPQIADSLGFNKSNTSPTLRKGPIEIHRLSELLPEKHLPSRCSRTKTISNGPFIDFSDAEVLQHLEKMSGQCNTDNELLWNLVAIAARWKGSLRSADGYSNKDGPEAAIVNLLLRNENAISGGSFISPSFIENKEESNSCLSEAQKLLLRGKREEAVKCALTGGDHALALLIASICGPNTFHTTAKYFIDKTLKAGTPLHTAAGLYANQIQSPEDADSQAIEFWTERSESLNETWQYHLATILSNQTRGWKKVVTALGDELLYARNTSAAHFCYLVCGRPITQHTNPSSRLVLLGCDHRIKNQVALLTNVSWEAYLRTEAYEWAKRRGNPNAVITTLQPFKLRYAILLADFGFEEIGKAYLDSIRKCTRLYPSASDRPGKSTNMNMYSPVFLDSLDVFEDRLSISLGVPNKNAVKDTSKLGFSSVLSKIVPKSMTPKPDDYFSDPICTNASFDDADDQDNDDTNISFVSASSNLLDTTVNTLATARSTMGNSTAGISAPQMMSTVNEGIKEIPTPQKQETLKPSPMLMTTPVKNIPASGSKTVVSTLIGDEKSKPLERKPVQNVAATPTKLLDTQQKRAPASTPLTATPSTMHTPVDRQPKNEAPSSASSWSVRGWLTKKLNPDATEADVGGKMEAYYDEKLKRWIFPGDDPQEVAKPLAPPPTTPIVKESQRGMTTPIPASNDPLAMLMAPPSRTTPKADPLSNLMPPPSRSTPSSALRGPPRIPRSHNVPSPRTLSTAKAPGADSGSAPPYFVIFTPKPADETKEKK